METNVYTIVDVLIAIVGGAVIGFVVGIISDMKYYFFHNK